MNRSYMNLDVWKKANNLFRLVWNSTHENSAIDVRLRSQINASAQSVAANIAEGYSRRSIKEYIRFSYIALSSMSETFTRAVGLLQTGQLTEARFKTFDTLHFEVENKLLRLIKSLEKKRDNSEWTDSIQEDLEEFNS